MKQESINKLKERMIATYKKFGNERAMLQRTGKSWTGIEIAEEIEKETEFGIKILDMMIQLTIDLVKRDKINVE